jgi:XRE family transcriptional regulator, regulator of sulfur utilization
MSSRGEEAARQAPRIGEALRALREEQRISPAELAGRSGISAGAVRSIERGERSPLLSTLQSLGEALGVGAAGIVRRSEEQEATGRDLDS